MVLRQKADKKIMYLVWRSVQHMHCKCACYKSQQWLRFHYGTIGERRNLHNTHSGNGNRDFRVLMMLMIHVHVALSSLVGMSFV